jgi:hypothetical protein
VRHRLDDRVAGAAPVRRCSPSVAVTFAGLPMTALSNWTSAVVSCESDSPSSFVACPLPQPTSSSDNIQAFVVWVRMAPHLRKLRAARNS